MVISMKQGEMLIFIKDGVIENREKNFIFARNLIKNKHQNWILAY